MLALVVLCAFNVLSFAGSIAFDSLLSMQSTLSEDQQTASFTVTLKAKGWFGFGVSLDGTMSSSGRGSDIVICSSETDTANTSEAKRYFIDRYGPPSNGSTVAGAGCVEYDEGISIMTFNRSLKANSGVERAFNSSGLTTLIWAYNTDTAVLNTIHTAKGKAQYDIVGPPAPTPSAPIEGGLQLDSTLSVATSLAPTLDKITFTLHSTAGGWMGIGVSPDGSMTNGGAGSDVVACSGGVVMRYWITVRSTPTNGSVVPGATCQQNGTGSSMQFTRLVIATSPTERPISVTGPTTFIWGYSSTSPTLNFHTNKSRLDYDVHNPPTVITASPTRKPTAPTTSAPTVITTAPSSGAPTTSPSSAAPTPSDKPIEGQLQLDSVLRVRTSLAPTLDNITITLSSTYLGWIAFGVSTDGTMISGGNGSDVVACIDGVVMRYWVTKYGPPTGGVIVPGSTCEQTGAGSSMTYTRQIAANGPTERAINVTGPTNFIWAYTNVTTNFSHWHMNQSSVSYDVHNPPVPPTPSVAPTPAALPIVGQLQLDPVLSLKTTLAATRDKVSFALKSTAPGWMAFGVSTDGSMTSSGAGSDVFACASGVVKRYWITKYGPPTDGVTVADATCEQSGSGSSMQFTRLVAATSPTERAINATGLTTFIWAYNTQDTTLARIHTNKSAVAYDVHNPPAPPTPAPTPAGPVEGGTKLDSVMSLHTVLSAARDQVTISLKSTAAGWMGIGVSTDGTMTSASNGSDVIACSNGTVQRYWVTALQPPTNGVPVPGATCEQSAGGSSMQFTRLVAATSATERPISVTGPTNFIWAYHLSIAVMNKHHSNRSSLLYDVHSPPSPAPTPLAPTMPAPTPAGMHFDDVMSGMATLSEDKNSVKFTVTAKQEVWIALGVSPVGDMIDGGAGSDVIACSGGTVMRYWVTTRSPPQNGVVVPGASCKQEGGVSTMEFTRQLAGGNKEHPISVNGDTMFIWAYGNGVAAFTTAIHKKSGNLLYNVATGQGNSVKLSPTAVLWVHMLAMLVAWGALLPFGVTFARYMRKHPDAKLWFTVHRTCQYVGWACQILGFIMAIVYVSSSNGSHFSGSYAYHKIIGLITVIFGTLQPLNAYFRPHPHPDIDTSRGCDDARTCWEFLHKACGYLAIALGAFNVFSGVVIAEAVQFKNAFWLIPLVVGAVSIGSMMLFALNKEICGKGKEDPRPVVGRSERNRKNSEMAGDLKAQLIPE